MQTFFFRVSYRRPGLGDAYRDHIVKWCSGVACSWCMSLDIAAFLTLCASQFNGKEKNRGRPGIDCMIKHQMLFLNCPCSLIVPSPARCSPSTSRSPIASPRGCRRERSASDRRMRPRQNVRHAIYVVILKLHSWFYCLFLVIGGRKGVPS